MPPQLESKPRAGNNGDDSLDIASQLVTVRAELSALQDRYDALHADRDRLAHLLEENMRKYKRFKRWVFVTKLKVPPKADKGRVDATPLPQSQPTIKMLETPITHRSGKRTPTKFVPSPRSPLSPSKSILNTPQKRRVPSVSEGSPSTCRLKRTRDENDSVETVEDTSQTQDDSQALTFWSPSTPSQRDLTTTTTTTTTTKRPPTSCPSIPHHAPTPPTKRPRHGHDVPQVPRASTSSASASAPITRYKRARGVSPAAINAEFEIDPVANAGVPFAFDEVVRGRRHRHGLDAGECEECRDWYAAVGPLPPRLEAPRWSSSPPPPSSPTLVPSECNSNSNSTKSTVRAHRQAVSRHRAQWERAPTPPGYWEIGFPDTQAVEKINEKAAEIHRQKRAAIAREAKGGGGRYRRRVP
ncbi:hypothetical protein V8E53_007405 [Lactarius tabidus]